MEHTCDGIYPGLFRLSRFLALVGLADGGNGSSNANENSSANMNGNTVGYDVMFTGTVPEKMGFKLQAASGARETGIVIQVRYNKKQTYAIKNTVEDELVEALTFDEGAGQIPLLPQTKKCGENRFLPLENTLQFYITTEKTCNLEVNPLDVIRATIRMQWTLDEFYADGGTTNFVDRLAGSLGIHASTIKVVTVYEGSVVVVFEIQADDPDSSSAATELEQVQSLLETLLAEE